MCPIILKVPTASAHIVTSMSDPTKPMDETYWQDNSLSINNSADPSEPVLKADDNLNQVCETLDLLVVS